MIYSKTQSGQSALQNRGLALLPRQRSVFIMFDGKRDLATVMQATAGLGVTTDDVNHLVSLGLLVKNDGSGDVAQPSSPPVSVQQTSAELSQTPDGQPTASAQAHYLKAYPIATRLTAGLGLRGFRLNLAVEAAGDLDKLKELAPRIREAVGPVKFLELENALYY